MIGEILNAIILENKALLSGTGAQTMLKTNFKTSKLPDTNGNFVLLAIEDAPDTTQFPGGLTMCVWKWSFGSYNWEPDAYVDDDSGYSTSLLDFIDTIRQHYSLGALGKGVVTQTGTLIVGIVYQVINGTIVYNSNTLQNGTFFVCIDGFTTYTSPNNAYVVGTSWLTQAMVTIFNTYGFQFTLTGITAADAIDQDGLIMGFKIAFDSTAFDQVTQFNQDDVILTTITEILNDEVNVDETFETILFPTIGFQPLNYQSAILNHEYNILRPNFAIDVTQNSVINLNNTQLGSSGQIEVTLLTGSETLQLNGISNFTKPTMPGTFIINYINSAGSLIFN